MIKLKYFIKINWMGRLFLLFSETEYWSVTMWHYNCQTRREIWMFRFCWREIVIGIRLRNVNIFLALDTFSFSSSIKLSLITHNSDSFYVWIVLFSLMAFEPAKSHRCAPLYEEANIKRLLTEWYAAAITVGVGVRNNMKIVIRH